MNWRKHKWLIAGIAAATILLSLIYIFRYVILLQIDPQVAAKHLCHRFAYYGLNDRNGAEFDSISKFTVTQRQQRFTVKGGVRAKNVFNATVYNVIRCEFHRSGNTLVLDDLAYTYPKS